MPARKSKKTKKHRKYRALRLVVMCCAAQAIGIFCFINWFENGFSKHCDDVAEIKHGEIIQREIVKAAVEKNERVSKLLSTLSRSDRVTGRERQKWTQQIESSTLNYIAHLKRTKPEQVSPHSFVNYQSVNLRGSLAGSESPTHYPTKTADSETARNEADSLHWSLKRVNRPVTPNVPKDFKEWCKNPIDQFVLKKMLNAGLTPNPPATQAKLARRLSYDITGLPLTEIRSSYWLETQDDNPQSTITYDEYVNELLDNDGFGEHWARMWLDVAGYADSNGYEEDEIREKSYTYRDFVIWAMNNDLPFDEFARWQIAGDELAPNNPMAVAATGFMTTAPYNTFRPQESERMDELDKLVSTYGSAILGMSVGCARCHDHFYDEISTEEYYRMVAIFSETERTSAYLDSESGKGYREFYDLVKVRQDELDKMQYRRLREDSIADLEDFTEEEKNILRKPIDPDDLEQDRLISICKRCLDFNDSYLDDDFVPLPEDEERYEQLKAEVNYYKRKLPACPPQGLALQGSKISETAILENGDLKNKNTGELVGPGFLACLTPELDNWDEDQWKQWAPTETEPLPRSALATWTTDTTRGAGAIVARVIVNRLWQQYFGRGLVTTAGDFGLEGDTPSHAELLDWLAMELIDHNWSLKHIHRLILSSATYRQDSKVTLDHMELDQENIYLGRFKSRRITSEMMRDSMLLAAGNLNPTMYGPAVMPPIPRDAVFNTEKGPEETWPIDYEIDREALWRRGIYVLLRRTMPVPVLKLFDGTDGSFSCQQRKTSTLPTQALALFNSPFVTRQSRFLAERILQAESQPEKQVQLLVRLTLGRQATSSEILNFVEFLSEKPAQTEYRWKEKNLEALCQVLFMSNEFFYIN